MVRKLVTFTMSERQSQWEVNRIEEEARKMGVGVNKVLYREMTFDLSNGSSRVLVRGERLTRDNTLGLWFRVAGTKSGKYTEGRNLAIRILQSGIFCCNHEGYLKWSRMGKIAQHGVFIENDIPIVPTNIFYQKEQLFGGSLGGDVWGWPVIAKHEKGYQGKSVRKFDSKEELGGFVDKINEKNIGMFLWQKYLPTRWDIRVIVLGGRAIGAMKRSAVGEEFRSNYSLGGMVENWGLSLEERALAEKVAEVCGLDYCGVDIMKDFAGQNYVLEVNRQCQFQGFEKATRINVAKKVVEMFVEKE